MRFTDMKRGIGFVAVVVLASAAFITNVHAAPAALPVQNVPAQAAQPIANTITVSGFGQAYGKPNIATVQLGVEAYNADASKAIADANDSIAKITSALTAAGVAETDIQTQNYNLFSTNPSPEPAKSTDARVYQAQIMLLVKVRDITKTGAVIDAGIKAGVTNIYGLTFGIDDTSKLESEARTKAIENARSRAAELAKALGVKLGDPIIIQEGLSNGPVPISEVAYAGKGGGAAQLSEGQLSVGVNLQITFAISK